MLNKNVTLKSTSNGLEMDAMILQMSFFTLAATLIGYRKTRLSEVKFSNWLIFHFSLNDIKGKSARFLLNSHSGVEYFYEKFWAFISWDFLKLHLKSFYIWTFKAFRSFLEENLIMIFPKCSNPFHLFLSFANTLILSRIVRAHFNCKSIVVDYNYFLISLPLKMRRIQIKSQKLISNKIHQR